MAKKKNIDNTIPPTNMANLSQNMDKKRNVPAGAVSGSGLGAGQGSK